MAWINPQQYYISSASFKNFRIIKDISFEPAKCLNVFAGKNGTAKSTILGMIAQGFSFNPRVVDGKSKTEYNSIKSKNQKDNDDNKFIEEYEKLLTYNGKNFESVVNEHFKLSPSDVTRKKHAEITLASNRNNKPNVSFMIESNEYTDRKNPRLVTRRITDPANDESTDTSSSNLLFPVIYLGLNRVTPIVQASGLKQTTYDLPDADKNEIFDLYQSILLKDYSNNFKAISNDRDKRTAAFIPEERSIEMISSGEDNLGQILLALYSFKKLKNQYSDYQGGILLIDEIDVTLYPAAQLKLINVIYTKAKEFGIQVFCTTHSLELIDYAMELKLSPNNRNFINLFNLCNKKNELDITPITNVNEVHNQFLVASDKPTITEKIPVYFEDKEAIFVFKSLVTNKHVTSKLNIQNQFSLGCSELIKLNRFKIAEFTSNSIVCLDGDNNVPKSMKNYISLPSPDSYPPERFVFEILNNSQSDYWNKVTNYDYSIFLNNPHNDVIRRIVRNTYLEDSDGPYFQPISDYYKKKPREVWKMWFNEEKKHWIGKNNPVKYWKAENNDSKVLVDFYTELRKAIEFVSIKRGIDNSDITSFL